MDILQGVQILLVEDEALIAMSERALLERYGLHVTVVHSGEAALDLFRAGDDVELVLMDIDLGRGMDGTETAERILSSRELPIIFLSSHTEPEIVARTERITSYGYVVKHSGEHVLIASIKMALRLFSAHERLRTEGENLRAVMRAAPVGMLVVDQGYVIRDANPAADALVGCEEGRLVGLRVADVLGCELHSSELDECTARDECATCTVLDHLGSVLQHRISVTRQESWFSLSAEECGTDRRKAWLRYSVGPLSRNGNREALMTVQDETTHRAEQERLRVLSTIAESDHIAVIVTDAEGRTTWVNDTFVDLTGYTLDELSGRPPGVVLQGPETDIGVRSAMRRAQELGEPFRGEILYYSRDGQPHWFAMDVQPVTSFDGSTVAFVAMGEDVTERRNYVEQLRVRSERSRLLMDRIVEGVLVFDGGGTVRYANPTYPRLIGHELQDGLGWTPDDVFARIHALDREYLRRDIYGAIDRRASEARYRYRSLSADGSPVWREDRAYFFYDGTGDLQETWVLVRLLTADDEHEYQFEIVG